MFDFLAGTLAFFYELWPSYGGAIVLFTMAVMLVLSPLSIKSTRSMLALQRVGPDLKKLQQKHKGDREALNKEMMAFYQENNINPLSSCLPLILQLPVFFVLYQVLMGLTRRSVSGDATSTFNPKYFEGENTPLAVALRGANEMRSFGMDLSQSALSELRSDGVLVALPFIILILLVGVAAWYQQRQISGRNPSVNPQQQRIAKFIPIVFPAISISIPAGVVVYFVVSSMVRIGQQAVVSKLEGGPALARAGPDPKKPEAKKPDSGKPEAKKPGAGKPEAKKPGAGKPEAKRAKKAGKAQAGRAGKRSAKAARAKATDGKRPEAKKPQARGNERRGRRADARNQGDGASAKDGGSNGARAGGQAGRSGGRSPGGQGRTGSQSGGSRSRSRKKRRK